LLILFACLYVITIVPLLRIKIIIIKSIRTTKSALQLEQKISRRNNDCCVNINGHACLSIRISFYRAAECRRGLAMRILPVCLSVKRVDCEKMEKDLNRFLYHTKYHLVQFSEKKNG